MPARAHLLAIASLCASAALFFAALCNTAIAAAPSGQDQYLEQVPNTGGNSGQNSNDDFVQSVGGDDGTVTEQDVERAAEKQKKRQKDSSGEEGPSGATGPETPPVAKPPVESVAAAAKVGPFSRTTFFILCGIALLIAGGTWYWRSNNAQPPSGGGTFPGA